MLELIFTSAKEGLIPGRSGFCSVAWTEGMPMNLVIQLESMSGYNVLYPPDDPKAGHNPVCFSYQKMRYGQKEYCVLSRIAFAGLDYTGRTNKFAHHIVLEDKSELDSLQNGPVSAFLADTNFLTSWDGAPRLLPRKRKLDSAQIPGLKAEQWEKFTGHAEWAAVIADAFLSGDGKKCLYIEYEQERHGDMILALINEVVRVLPKEAQNEFTFNTYFSAAQPNVNCFLRAVLPDSQVLPAIKRFKPQDLISLTGGTNLPHDIPWSPALMAATRGAFPQIAQKKEDPLLQNAPDKPASANPEDRRQAVASAQNDVPGATQPGQAQKKKQSRPQDDQAYLQTRRKMLVISLAILFLILIVGAAIRFTRYRNNTDSMIQEKNMLQMEKILSAKNTIEKIKPNLESIENGMKRWDLSKRSTEVNAVEAAIPEADENRLKSIQSQLRDKDKFCGEKLKELKAWKKDIEAYKTALHKARQQLQSVYNIRLRDETSADKTELDCNNLLGKAEKLEGNFNSAGGHLTEVQKKIGMLQKDTVARLNKLTAEKEEKKKAAASVPVQTAPQLKKQTSDTPAGSVSKKGPGPDDLYKKFRQTYSHTAKDQDNAVLQELKPYFCKNGQPEKGWIKAMVQTFLDKELVKRGTLDKDFTYSTGVWSEEEQQLGKFLERHGLYLNFEVSPPNVEKWEQRRQEFSKKKEAKMRKEKELEKCKDAYLPPQTFSGIKKTEDSLNSL